jgi:dienelactone hydrolase
MMQDVVAVDLTRVSLTANPDFPGGQQGVTGQSHGAEVATKTAVMSALLAPTIIFAPLALMNGFKRGEQAVIPEGRRFVVYVQKDTIVRIPTETKTIRIDR